MKRNRFDRHAFSHLDSAAGRGTPASCDILISGTGTPGRLRQMESIRRGTIMTPKTTSITTVAEAFFDACETGKGWEVCSAYCTPDATFSAQAEPLLDLKTLA